MAQLSSGHDYHDDLFFDYDTIYSGAGNDTVLGWSGDDYIDDIFVVGIGGGGNDLFYGEQGNDTLYGWSGNDTLDGGSGNDYLYGESGNDDMDGWTGNDYMSGGSGVDTMYGYSGNDTIYGGSSKDYIYSEAGNDSIVGGTGADYLSGGAGYDKFDYNAVSESNSTYGKDKIAGFDFGWSQATGDKIDLKDLPGLQVWGLNVWTAETLSVANTDTIVYANTSAGLFECTVADGAMAAAGWLALDFILI